MLGKAARTLREEALGGHIVSMTHALSDVLAALWLMRLHDRAGAGGPAMDIVPLFETIRDFEHAPGIVRDMLDDPEYRHYLARRGNVQTVMIGNSDCTKDGGYLTARSIRALPPESLGAGLRMTEQGEVLADRYDDPQIAGRHLEQATPIVEIESLPIAFRPAHRHGIRSLGDLRAIPWVFAWTQNRCMIPAWYGIGAAFQAFTWAHPEGWRTLQEMYAGWPFFRVTLDNAVLALARTDLEIGRMYADLVDDEEVRVRNPNTGPLNLIQVEWLRRLREAGDRLRGPFRPPACHFHSPGFGVHWRQKKIGDRHGRRICVFRFPRYIKRSSDEAGTSGRSRAGTPGRGSGDARERASRRERR